MRRGRSKRTRSGLFFALGVGCRLWPLRKTAVQEKGSWGALSPSLACDTSSVHLARLLAVLVAAAAAWLAVTALPAPQLYLVLAFDAALAVVVRAVVGKPTAAPSRRW
jgi:hypothetical protein